MYFHLQISVRLKITTYQMQDILTMQQVIQRIITSHGLPEVECRMAVETLEQRLVQKQKTWVTVRRL